MAANRYEITLADGYGRELDRLVVQAHNLRLALLVSEAVLRGRRAGHGQDAVSASVELLGAYMDELPPASRVEGFGGVPLGALEPSPEPELEGNVTCARCGAVFAWAGELPDTCLRCGRRLEESRVIYACQPDESAGQAELHSVRHELHELPQVGGVDLEAVARLEEFSRGLGEIDTSEED